MNDPKPGSSPSAPSPPSAPSAPTLADPAVQACPWAYYAGMHAVGPVHFDAATGLWMIAAHAQLTAAALNWEAFSSEIDMRRDVSTVDCAAADALLRRDGWIAPDVLTQVDPPRHTQYRKLVEKIFTGPVVRRMNEYLDAHIVELIDGFAARGRVDFISEFAGPLPVDVIADQLGLPRADGVLIRQWTDAIIETLDVMITAERRLACTQRIVEFQRYFVARREEKRARPREDILSALAVVRKPDGTELSTEDYLALCAQLMVAGNDTTRNHLTKAMYLLTQDPELQARLRREPALIPRFVEESLRVEAPVQGLFRTCREDVVLGGVTIPKGAKVVLLYGAANRDPSAFPDPGRIDLDRPNTQRHVSFGHGVHSCVGRVLATAELTLSFRRLLERLDNIRLDPDWPAPRHRPHFSLRGLDSLNLAFDTALPAR